MGSSSTSAVHDVIVPTLVTSVAPIPVVAAPPRSTVRTRLFAAVTLLTLVAAFGAAAMTGYRALRDSFVAPAILSPDSDLVLSNKLKLSELQVERARAAAELEGIESDLTAAAQALARLQDLRKTAATTADWTTGAASRKASEGGADVKALASQKAMIVKMLNEQKTLTAKAKADSDAGVISLGDYAREAQAQRQLEIALIENERTALQSQASLHETVLARQALARRGAAMPEMLTAEEQIIRIELEIMRLESEQRSKLAQKLAVTERLSKIDELDAQLKSRPIFQAVSRSLDVAFVPYTQLDGVAPGADVYDCVWGLFWCKPVGSVAELVPGEVILPDPWGNQARGQYAVLNLADHEAAKSKTLRIRPGSAHAASSAARVAPNTALSQK
jgi:hypothetical protein